jgi:hypothetical protein
MRRFGLLLLLFAAGALAEADDPIGTVSLEIEVGKTAPVSAPHGASILCDDPGVVAPEFTADGNGLLLRALRPGSTLCGVWLPGEKPGGLYRVRIGTP